MSSFGVWRLTICKRRLLSALLGQMTATGVASLTGGTFGRVGAPAVDWGTARQGQRKNRLPSDHRQSRSERWRLAPAVQRLTAIVLISLSLYLDPPQKKKDNKAEHADGRSKDLGHL